MTTLRVLTPLLMLRGVGLDDVPAREFVVGETMPTREYVGPRRTPTHVINGNVTLTTAQTFEGHIVYGRIDIPQSAKGLIWIRDNRINAEGTAMSGSIINIHPNTGAIVIIEYNEITGTVGQLAVGVRRNLSRFNYVHHVEDGFRVHNYNGTGLASDVIIEANLVEQLIVRTPDPNRPRSDDRTHSDCIQLEGCDGTIIRGNALHCMASTDGTSNIEWALTPLGSDYKSVPAGTPDAKPHPQGSQVLALTPTVSPVTNLLVEKNWMFGGERGINAGNNLNVTTTAQFLGNRFDRMQWFTDAGRVINIDSSDQTAPYRMVESGNVFMDDGSPVPVGRRG